VLPDVFAATDIARLLTTEPLAFRFLFILKKLEQQRDR
jgi:hypothetical protein